MHYSKREFEKEISEHDLLGVEGSHNILSFRHTRPAQRGDTSQLPTILPISIHLTVLPPNPAIPIQMMALTMAWVVETGHPRDEANRTQVDDPTKEHTMPSIKSSGWAANNSTSVRPPLIVSVVAEPIKKAPKNSQTVAMSTACLRLRALEPTAAPKELLTSFVPILLKCAQETTE
jgi:hypothetical protein